MPARPGGRRPRVFGIGLHKTGTTSLAEALSTVGYRTLHGAGELRRAVGHHAMFEMLRSGELEPIWVVAERFDAFADNPWFSLFREADQRFPGSRFILTRRDPDRWLQSAVGHFGTSTSDFRRWIYGVGSPVGNEGRFLTRYRAHETLVERHFAGRPGDLLVMDLEAGDGWDALCGFLNVPKPMVGFPHANRRLPSP